MGSLVEKCMRSGVGVDEKRKEEELRAVVGHVAREMMGELVVDVIEYLGELVR